MTELGGRRVLVTGADGFIGSHLTEALLARGANVRALALYNSFNDWGWLEGVPASPSLEIVTGDVRDPQLCRLIAADVDVVFHLAALIAIPYSYRAPASYVDTNVQGTLNMCQAALDAKCSRFIHTSTSEVYGTARYVPINEEHPLQPQSPYSASKIGADSIASSFHAAFGLPVTIARPFNTFGPRQSARAVIPTIISQLAAGKAQIELGDVRPTRDLNYVADTCAAMIELARNDATVGDTYNLGSNTEISVAKLFEEINSLMGTNAAVLQQPERLRPTGSEVMRLVCDNTKLKRTTGFTPKYDLTEGLRQTIEWFLIPSNRRRYKDLYNV